MKASIVEIIIKHMTIYFEPDDDFGCVALGAAEEILQSKEFNRIRKALLEFQIIINSTFAHDEETGERIDEQGEYSAADIVELCCNSEIMVGEAIDAIGDDEETIQVQFTGFIVIGDQVQNIETNWQGRVTGFDRINGETYLVCHHVSGGEIEEDDKRWFDPRDVRLLRKADPEPAEPAETMTCDLCGTLEDEHDAIETGWAPSYWIRDDEMVNPVCPTCVRYRLKLIDGELFLVNPPSTLKELVDRLKALRLEHDNLEHDRQIEHDDRPSLKSDEEIDARENEIYVECYEIAQEIVSLNPTN